MKNKVSINILMLITLFFCSLAFSGEEQEMESAKKENQISSESADENKNVKKRSSIKTLEEFVPSEEVSADKPVAFPTDI